MSQSPLNVHATHQKGAILVLSLVLLLTLTVLALAVSGSLREGQYVSRNARDADIAFEAAELGLRAAERHIQMAVNPDEVCTTPTCTNYSIEPNKINERTRDSIWVSVKDEKSTTSPTSDRNPAYSIDGGTFVPDSLTIGAGVPTGRFVFRSTSVGFGNNTAIKAIVEGTFIRRFDQ